MASLVRLLQSKQGTAKITPKQWDKTYQILDEMAQDEKTKEANKQMAEEDAGQY